MNGRTGSSGERAGSRHSPEGIRLFVECRRKGQVAENLNAKGYRTRDGSIWRDTSISRILE